MNYDILDIHDLFISVLEGLQQYVNKKVLLGYNYTCIIYQMVLLRVFIKN